MLSQHAPGRLNLTDLTGAGKSNIAASSPVCLTRATGHPAGQSATANFTWFTGAGTNERDMIAALAGEPS